MKHFATLGALIALVSLTMSLQAGDHGGETYDGAYYSPTHSDTGYIFVYGGYTFGPEVDALDRRAGNALNFQFENGFNVGGGIGIFSDFLGGSRFEFEGMLLNNDLDTATFNGAGVAGASGDLKIGGAAVNFLKSFYLGDRFQPYIGAGIGYGSIDIDYFVGNQRVGSTSDTKAIFQGIVGADIPVGDNLALFGQYKALNIGETDWGPWENDSFVISAIMAGLRWTF